MKLPSIRQTAGIVTALAVLSLGSGTFANDGPQQFRSQSVTQVKKAAPCVNPDAPCPGAPVILNLRKLSKMGKRETQAYIQKRLGENFPESRPEIMEGETRLINSLLATNFEEVDGDPIATVSRSGCCTLTLTIKITFGKK